MVRLGNSTLISIVDDDESFRTAVRDMVESFGYRVAAFASGVEFLGSDRLRDSACLITDVCMPGMSGFELHSRTVAAGHSIPTIFFTAFPDEKGNDRAAKAGAVAYLSKPCHRDDLQARIHSALDRGKADVKGS
jgi:FixJ family two-component response regulator